MKEKQKQPEPKKFNLEYTDEELIAEIQDIERSRNFQRFMKGMKLYGKWQQLVDIYNKVETKEK